MFLALFLGGVTITLSPEATVRGTEIPLSAIATIDGADAAEVERVRALKLGYAPAPGYTRTLAAPRLSADLARLVPGVTLDFKGALACRVSPATERITAAQLENAARQEVTRALVGREFELVPAQQFSELVVPAGNAPIDVRTVLGDTALRPGPINVPVRVTVDGTLYRTVWTNWRLSIWEDANVLRRAVAAGETLTPELIERKRVLSTGAGADTTLTAGLAIGSTARRELPAGHVLREVDVHRELIVKRGDTLFLEVRRGAIQARVAATAEQDAHSGDRIRLKLQNSERTMTATVVSRDLARIDFEGNATGSTR